MPRPPAPLPQCRPARLGTELPVTYEVEGQLAKHFGNPDNGEINLPAYWHIELTFGPPREDWSVLPGLRYPS